MSGYNHAQESTKTILEAALAADVIRYYHDNANKDARERGWKDKEPLGRSAIHATLPLHTMRPSGIPMLTFEEMHRGLDHIQMSGANENPDINEKPPASGGVLAQKAIFSSEIALYGGLLTSTDFHGDHGDPRYSARMEPW